MSTGILVFVETRAGQVRKAALEALSEAIAKAGSEPVTALLIGSGVKALADQVGKYKAAKVLVADSDAFKAYSTEAFTDALVAAVQACDPRYVFAAHTAMARDFVPRAAARLDAPCVADVTELRSEGSNILPIRPMYSGKCLGVYEITAPLGFITMRPNIFALGEANGSGASVEDLAVTAGDVKAKISEVQASQGNKVELSEAAIVVAGGRGIKGRKTGPFCNRSATVWEPPSVPPAPSSTPDGLTTSIKSDRPVKRSARSSILPVVSLEQSNIWPVCLLQK